MLSPIIVALDMEAKSAIDLAKELNPKDCKLKVGSYLFTSSGPVIVEKLNSLGFDVFLDLKFHDIPNTVSRAIQAAIDMGVWMLNIHSLGGKQMLYAANEVIKAAPVKPLLIGVTVLTSLDNEALKRIGLGLNTKDQVLLLAELCKQEGLDGVVCSPKEVKTLKRKLGNDFLLVCPGIRSGKYQVDDQKRFLSATQAIDNGADFIVIGRDITTSSNPKKKISEILDKVSQIL